MTSLFECQHPPLFARNRAMLHSHLQFHCWLAQHLLLNLFEVFTQPLLPRKTIISSIIFPSLSIFSILSFIAFSNNSDRRFRLSAALQDGTSAASGSFTCTSCLECPRHKVGNQSALKRYQSLAGSPDTK